MAFDLTGALLDEDGSWPAYGLPQAAVLAVAARRRFPHGYQPAEVVRSADRTRADRAVIAVCPTTQTR